MVYVGLSESDIRELEEIVRSAIEKCKDESGEVDESCIDDVFDARSEDVRKIVDICDPFILLKMLYDYYVGEGGWDPWLIEEELMKVDECVDSIMGMAEKLYCYMQLVDAWWTIHSYYSESRSQRKQGL
jgi:hypothetical protein